MAISIPVRAVRRNDHLFYGGMAVVCALVVFVGFSRTYYLTTYFNGPALTALRHVHGALFTTWIVFFITQTMLVASHRTDIHRKLGVAGAVLAVLMVAAGSILAIEVARAGRSPVPSVTPLAFLSIPLFDMLVFATLVAAGVYYRRRAETHKRLMLLATISLLVAAVSRFPTDLTALGPPFFFGVVDLLVLAGPAYDLITRRRVHPAYIWGGLWVILSQPLRLVVSGTAAWTAFAQLLTR